jgi:ABC-type lipoprotein release transport system permease subunit
VVGLVGCFVGWLFCLLVDSLVGWLVGLWVCWFVGLVYNFIDWVVVWLFGFLLVGGF